MNDTPPLRSSRCSACGTVYFPPRSHCVECYANPETEIAELRGTGTLYSITNVHVGPLAPCSFGYVDLDEGVRALARFEAIDDPLEYVGKDQRVHISYGTAGTDTEKVVLGSFSAS